MTNTLTNEQRAFVERALEGWQGHLVVDANSHIIEGDEGIAELSGWSRGELSGMTLSTLLPRRTMSYHGDYVRKVIEDEQRMTGMGPVDRSLALIHRSGTPVELHLDRCWIPGTKFGLVVLRTP